MLKRLHLRNFTVFADAEFEFGAGLNVIVGANGAGKSNILKLGYVIVYEIFQALQQKKNDETGQQIIAEQRNSEFMFDKLRNVFQPYPFKVSELIRRDAKVSESVIEMVVVYPGGRVNSSMKFTHSASNGPLFILPQEWENNIDFIPPVFIPAKEVLTMGWLSSLYERREIPIDETYPDLLTLLSGPPLRQPKPFHIAEKLSQLIGGKVDEAGGRFFLNNSGQQGLEMNLVAEGMRKFATLYKLLANGTLTPETTLFWDEPEANLNPALLKDMAVILTDLAEAGFQIILATHSLFLMRELHILAQQKKKSVRYFGLYASEEGDVRVEQQDDLMQLRHLVALDAELTQTFDFEAALDQDYAGDN